MIGHLVRRARAEHRDDALLAFEAFLADQEQRVRARLDAVMEARRERLKDPWLGIREADSLEMRR